VAALVCLIPVAGLVLATVTYTPALTPVVRV
jgi:hypothetical protein